MSNDIEAKVKLAVAEQLDVDIAEVGNNSDFVEDLGADSLDLAELVMSLENDFDITISDEESAKITTVQSAIDFVNSKLKEKA